MNITVTGAEARIMWGYRVAAILRAWTMQTTEGVLRVRGTLDAIDDFAVAQQPLKFAVSDGLTRPILELQRMGASCDAVLGPMGDAHVAMPVRTA